MALVSAPDSVRSSTTSKQIVLNLSPTYGTFLYVVPAGRMYTANATATNTCSFVVTVPSVITLHPVYFCNAAYIISTPFTFLPGTIIFSGGQGGTLFGIEKDLTI